MAEALFVVKGRWSKDCAAGISISERDAFYGYVLPAASVDQFMKSLEADQNHLMVTVYDQIRQENVENAMIHLYMKSSIVQAC